MHLELRIKNILNKTICNFALIKKEKIAWGKKFRKKKEKNIFNFHNFKSKSFSVLESIHDDREKNFQDYLFSSLFQKIIFMTQELVEKSFAIIFYLGKKKKKKNSQEEKNE